MCLLKFNTGPIIKNLKVIESVPWRGCGGGTFSTFAGFFIEVYAAFGAKSAAVIAANQIGRESEQNFLTDVFGYIYFVLTSEFIKHNCVIGFDLFFDGNKTASAFAADLYGGVASDDDAAGMKLDFKTVFDGRNNGDKIIFGKFKKITVTRAVK